MRCVLPGGVEVDLERQEIRRPQTPPSSLTANEQQLLAVLLAHQGQSVSREVLLSALGYLPTLETRALANAVRRLRKKLGDDTQTPRLLVSVYGHGYRLEGLPPSPPPLAEEDVGVAPAPEPVADGGLFGRAEVQATLRRLLVTGRLVTLVGPAGVGKTALARWSMSLSPGALFVDLSDALDAAGLVHATARALGVSLHRTEGWPAQLARIGQALSRTGAALVVLDNVEQISAPAAEAVACWRAQAPTSRLVVTSREPLQLGEEHLLRLEPLAVAAATQLFCARAPRVSADDPALPALVQALDGLPLALEFAAARCDLLRPAEIMARLSERFVLLRSRRRDLSRRVATLDAAIRWSWDLLSVEERAAMVGLAWLEGPFTLALAEALLEAEALERITSLVERSMLSLLPGPVPQLRMLLSVRAFVRAQSPSAQQQAARRRHAVVLLRVAEEAERALHRGEYAASLATLQATEADLVAIHRRGLARDPEDAQRAALALHGLWTGQRAYVQHAALLEEALQASRVQDDRWARLVAARSFVDIDAERFVEALAPLDAALETSQMAPLTRAMLLRYRGNIAVRLGHPALADYTAALDIALGEGSAWHEGMICFEMASMYRYAGEMDAAERWLQRARPLLQQTGHRFGMGCLLELCANLAMGRDDPARAHRYLLEAEALWAELRLPLQIAAVQMHRGSLMLDSHDAQHRRRALFDPAGAVEVFSRVLEVLSGGGWLVSEAVAQINLSSARLFLGAPQAARHHAQAAAALLSASHRLAPLASILEVVAAHRDKDPAAPTLRRLAEVRLQQDAPPHGAWLHRLLLALVDAAPPRTVLAEVPPELEREDEIVSLLVGLLLHGCGDLEVG